jgi:hypothetical protein
VPADCHRLDLALVWIGIRIKSIPTGRILLTNGKTLATDQLEALAMQNGRVVALQKSYPNEIVDETDIIHNTASKGGLASGWVLGTH